MTHASNAATPELPFEASMGIYVFNKSVLVELLNDPREAQAKPENHFGHHILPRALREDYRIMSYHFDKYWRVRPAPRVLCCPRHIRACAVPAKRDPGMHAQDVLGGVLSQLSVLPLRGACHQHAKALGLGLKGGCLQPLASLRDYFEVNLELSNPGSPVGIYQADETIVSRGHIAPPSTIHQCELKSTLVGEGSFLHVWAPCLGPSPAGLCRLLGRAVRVLRTTAECVTRMCRGLEMLTAHDE